MIAFEAGVAGAADQHPLFDVQNELGELVVAMKTSKETGSRAAVGAVLDGKADHLTLSPDGEVKAVDANGNPVIGNNVVAANEYGGQKVSLESKTVSTSPVADHLQGLLDKINWETVPDEDLSLLRYGPKDALTPEEGEDFESLSTKELWDLLIRTVRDYENIPNADRGYLQRLKKELSILLDYPSKN